MKDYQSRLDKLAAQLPGEETMAVFIRLGWEEEEAKAPVMYTRSPGGRITKRIGYSTIPQHLLEKVTVHWP